MVLKKALTKGLDPSDKTNNLENATQSKNEKIKKLEEEGEESDYVAPEGGWGWMVALGMVVVFVTVTGPSASFAIVFGDFLEETGQAGSALTMLNSLFNISYSVSSFLTDSLLKRFSMRTIGVIGAVLFSIPNVLTALVQHVFELGIYTFIQGIGLGLIFTICNTNFNNYFEKRRTMVMGISQVFIGLGGIVYPIGTEMLMEKYGFRGTAAISYGLSLNCIAAMALMRPPASLTAKLRRKKLGCKNVVKANGDEKSDETKKLLPVSDDIVAKPKEDPRLLLKKEDKWTSCRSLQDDDRSKKNDQDRSNARRSSITDVEGGHHHQDRRKSHLDSLNLINKIRLRRPHLAASFTSLSLGNLRVQPAFEISHHAASPMRASALAFARDEKCIADEKKRVDVTKDDDANKKTDEQEVSKKKKEPFYKGLVDFTLLKSRTFQIMCIGMSFSLISDWTFISFLPMMMSNRGFSKADAALTVTVSASAELASKICLAIFTIFCDARPRTIFFFSMIAMSMAKVGYLFLEDTLTGTIMMVAVIGSVRSWLFASQPLVVVENLNVDQYAAAYGVFAIVSGLISFVFGPFAGLMKDWTDSFTICQVVLISINSLFIIPWAIEIWLDRKKNRDRGKN